MKENDINAKTISATGDWLSFEVPVRKANDLFDADFSVYIHDETGAEAVRTLSYSIPAELQGHLDLVHPTVTFPNPRGLPPVFTAPIKAEAQNLTSRATIPSSCASIITPACLQAIYNIPSTRAIESSNKLAVTGYIEQYANKADLKTFLAKFRTDISSSTSFTLQTLDGGSNPQGSNQAGVEAVSCPCRHSNEQR